MLRDRGKQKKWQGFFMTEHTSMLKELEHDLLKQPRPQIDETQIEEFENLIQQSIEYKKLLLVTIWKDGYINKRAGIVKKINPIAKSILFEDELGSRFNVDFYSIINVEIV
ncbi:MULTISPECIES: YolD-like family protein [Metabacillus]|uniref:YolD-like family protein n=1 Tax=Metabacillus TaxID=2675233 RepID=UPI000C80A447|nr:MULTISPECIES: YolD-like family protein [Metabacillus]MCM3443969.1 YolD-like family protein [Metabacillus halosaccharovorans]PMC34977.1 YolD-like family protein [Bacillus sp. UMB0899]